MILPKEPISQVTFDEQALDEWQEEQEGEARPIPIIITEELQRSFNQMIEEMRMNQPQDYATLQELFR